MFWFKSRALFLTCVSTLACTIPPTYSATITTYSSLASWQAATTGDQTDNFEGTVPAGGYVFYPGATGFTNDGVEFIGLSGSIGVGDTSQGTFSFANFGTGEAGFMTGSSSITITLPSPVTAFGVNLFTSSAGLTYTVTTLGTPSTVPTSSSAPPTFFGVTSDTPFTTITLQAASGYTYAWLDNLSWGTAESGSMDPVPEAGTFLLIGTGLVAFALFRRGVQSR